MRSGCLELVALCLLVGGLNACCSDDLERERDDAAGGGSTSSQSAGGAAPWQESRPPFEGCETLTWAGEPVLIEAFDQVREPGLVLLEGGKVGVVYTDRDALNPIIASRVVDGAFDRWPPTVGDPVTHFTEKQLPVGRGGLSARADGSFALSGQAAGVYRFGEPGRVSMPEGASYLFVSVWLEPKDSGGAYLLRYLPGEPMRLSYAPQAHELAVERLVGEVEIGAGCGELSFAANDSSMAFALGPRLGCESNAPLQVFRLSGRPAARETHRADLELPFRRSRFFAHGDGFAYAFFPEDRASLELHHFDHLARPSILTEPVSDGQPSYDVDDIGTFRGGYALVTSTGRNARTPSEELVRLVVGDATHRTRSPELPAGAVQSATSPTLLVGGEDDRSIVVALTTPDGIALARADCAPGS